MNPGLGRGRPQGVSLGDQNQCINYSVLRKDFVNWIYKRVDSETAKKYVRYLDRYLTGFTIQEINDLIAINQVVKSGWNWYAKAVRNLINYCVEIGIISKEQANDLKETLKLKKTGFDTYVPSDEEVKRVLSTCNRFEMKLLMKLIYYSGIRIREALKILNQFDETKLHFVEDVAYYDMDWERGSKRAFKAFIPAKFAKELKRVNITEDAAHHYFRSTIRLPLKYGRNWFVDKMIKGGIQESIIRFMIGHSNGSVLMTSYLEKLNNSIHAYRKALPLLQSVLEQ